MLWWCWRRPPRIHTLSLDIILCLWTTIYHWSPQLKSWPALPNLLRLQSHLLMTHLTSSLSRLTFQEFIGHIQRLFTSCPMCLPCRPLLVAIFQAASCRCTRLLVTWCRRPCLLSFISPVIEGLIHRSCILVHYQWDILTKLVGLVLLAQDALSYDILPLRWFPSFQQCLPCVDIWLALCRLSSLLSFT